MKESFEMRDSSLHLVNASADKGTELWEPLTVEFPETTLRKIPKVLGSLKKIKLNDLKHRLEASPCQKDQTVDSLTWKIVTLEVSFALISAMAGLVVFISIWQKQGVRNKPTMLYRDRGESVKNVAHQQKTDPETEQAEMEPIGTGQSTPATPERPLRLAAVEIYTPNLDITNARTFLKLFLFLLSLHVKSKRNFNCINSFNISLTN